MKYYFVSIDEVQESVVLSLNIISGETSLFLSKGLDQLPTIYNYWKRSDRYKGDEIEISSNMFQNPLEMLGTYTIGVYCGESSKFSLVFAPDFGKIYHISFRKIVNIRMEPEVYYYLYFHKHDEYETYLYSS